jgi:hypothetical protein
VRTNLLVLVDSQLDHLIALQSGAFAAKSDPLLLPGPSAALDRFVDVAQPRLVGSHASLKLIVHATIVSHQHNPGARRSRDTVIRVERQAAA